MITDFTSTIIYRTWTAFGCGLICVTQGFASDWPRFRGPNGSGTVADARPPVTWSDSQNVKWKTELPGPGTSSPILVGGKVFLTTWTISGGLQRQLVCLERATGKVLWSKSVAGEKSPDRYEGFMQEH